MKKYGLIGYPLGHSFSKAYFDKKFSTLGVHCQYNNYAIETLDTLPRGLDGFSVTLPHKQNVMPLLDSLDQAAAQIGAVNCVDKNLRGYNTDVIGFAKSLLGLIGEARPDALVLGTGGASLAVKYVLDNLNIDYYTVSRGGDLRYDNLTKEMVSECKLIINTTPLGMFPDVDNAPAIPYEAIGAEHYMFDLVYNPAKTLFLSEGLRRGAFCKSGIEMLVEQAEAAWEIWNRS